MRPAGAAASMAATTSSRVIDGERSRVSATSAVMTSQVSLARRSGEAAMVVRRCTAFTPLGKVDG